MKRLAIVLTCAVALGACAHLPPPIRDFGICLLERFQAALTDVTAALEAGDTAKLKELAWHYGADVIDCAVHEVLTRVQSGAVDSASKATIRRTGEAWLRNHGAAS